MSGPPSIPRIWVRPKVTIATNTLRFRWYAPVSTGGSPILRYVLSSPQDSSYTIAPNLAGFDVNNLTPGTAYTYTLVAVNSSGNSPAATFRTVRVGPVPPPLTTAVAVRNTANSASIVNCYNSSLSSYNIGWVSAKTNILSGSGPIYTNSITFGPNSININNDNPYQQNNLNIDNNSYIFDMTYTNDSGKSAVVKTNPIGNVQYTRFYSPTRTTPVYNGALFTSIACSSNAQIVIACATSGYIWVSLDSGGTFIRQNGPGVASWVSVACSADGTKMVAVDGSPGYIWTSSNSGSSWTQRTAAGQRVWTAVGMSPNGTYVVAAVANSNVYTSSNSGVDWVNPSNIQTYETPNILTLVSCNNITVSNDGATLYLSDNANTTPVPRPFWYSNNFGSNWIPSSGRTDMYNTVAIKSTTTGSQIFLALRNGLVYVSYNNNLINGLGGYGPQKVWTSLTISDDGLKVAAAVNGDYIYYAAPTLGTLQASISSGQRNWTSIAASSSGQYLYATEYAGLIWFSNDYGATWDYSRIPTAVAANDLAVSNDGLQIVIASYPPYISYDGGIIWYFRNFVSTVEPYMTSTFMSSDKTFIAIVYNLSSPNLNFVVSRDSGVTWAQIATPPTTVAFGCIAGSSNGSILMVGTFDNGALPWRSTDSGATWQQVGASSSPPPTGERWNGAACDSTGTYFVMIGGNYAVNGNVWRSGDGGTTWTRTALASTTWSGVTCSSNGQYFYVCSLNGYIWRSSNYGVTWTQTTSPYAFWRTISSTPYGNNIVAGIMGGGFWVSTDFGDTWIQQTANGGGGNWRSVKYTGNANTFIAVASNTANPYTTGVAPITFGTLS